MKAIECRQAVRRGIGKTLSNPITYAAALLVGTSAFVASGTRWGYLVPFLAPLAVQSLARVLAELEAQTHKRKMQDFDDL